MLLPIDHHQAVKLPAVMILTCPACDTKYVVKDGAIPAAGRQVRCASCKHSWHQDPEDTSSDADETPQVSKQAEPQSEVEPSQLSINANTAALGSLDGLIATKPSETPSAPAPPPMAEDRQWQSVEPVAGWNETESEPPAAAAPDDFEPFYDHEPIEQPRRTWPLVLTLVLLVALAAVAFWFFAPAELRARAGLASNTESELHVVLNTNNYQRLASGNSLFTVSGRIINSTDERQPVPPIRAELLDATRQKVIYSWTIPSPAASLDLNDSTDFNSAEVGVPEGGKYIRLRFDGSV
jgi:predicted Zn finger-like uncharacterized protein